MKPYNYAAAVENDIRTWIEDDSGYRFDMDAYRAADWRCPGDVVDAMANDLFDLLFENDRVTGAASGYSDDEEELAGYLAGNEDALQLAVFLQGIDPPSSPKEKDSVLRQQVFMDACEMIATEIYEHWIEEDTQEV